MDEEVRFALASIVALEVVELGDGEVVRSSIDLEGAGMSVRPLESELNGDVKIVEEVVEGGRESVRLILWQKGGPDSLRVMRRTKF